MDPSIVALLCARAIPMAAVTNFARLEPESGARPKRRGERDPFLSLAEMAPTRSVRIRLSDLPSLTYSVGSPSD